MKTATEILTNELKLVKIGTGFIDKITVTSDLGKKIISNVCFGYADQFKKDIIELEKERLQWALKTFPEATANSSLLKLREEIIEIEKDIEAGAINSINEEYADALMCLFDSAGRLGIYPEQIFEAFKIKLEKNKNRTWIKNANNTYSHVKN